MILTPCRPAVPEEVPRAAASLHKAALAAGWDARTTYAKAEDHQGLRPAKFAAGDRVTRDGATALVIDVYRDKVHLGVLEDGAQGIAVWEIAETAHAGVAPVGKVVESIALRLRRPPQAAVGVWNNGKFAFAYEWSASTAATRLGARQLSKFVKGETP